MMKHKRYTLNEAKTFLKDFACIPEYRLKESIVTSNKDIEYYLERVKLNQKILLEITSRKALIKRKLKKYSKAVKEEKSNWACRKELWGILKLIVSRTSYEENISYLQTRITDSEQWIKEKKLLIKLAKSQLKELKNAKTKKGIEKFTNQARLLVQAVNDLKISKLRMIKSTGEMYFVMPIRNAVPTVVKEFKGNQSLNYDLELKFSKYGEFRARLIASQRNIVKRNITRYTRNKFGDLPRIKLNVHGSAYRVNHWAGMCQGGGSVGYDFDKYVEHNNPSGILRVACYMYHSFNPNDSYGSVERQEQFIEMFPKQFFKAIKTEPINLSEQSNVENIQNWLGTAVLAQTGGST